MARVMWDFDDIGLFFEVVPPIDPLMAGRLAFVIDPAKEIDLLTNQNV